MHMARHLTNESEKSVLENKTNRQIGPFVKVPFEWLPSRLDDCAIYSGFKGVFANFSCAIWTGDTRYAIECNREGRYYGADVEQEIRANTVKVFQ